MRYIVVSVCFYWVIELGNVGCVFVYLVVIDLEVNVFVKVFNVIVVEFDVLNWIGGLINNFGKNN